MVLVHGTDQIQLLTLISQINSLVANMLDANTSGLERCISDRGPLAVRRQESGSPVIHTPMGQSRADGNESGQILIFSPQPIGQPRPNTWTHKLITPRVQFQQRTTMSGIGAVQGS